MFGRTVHSLALLLLVTAYPFLSFWTNNLDETRLGDLARYGALAFAIVALGVLVLLALFRHRSGRPMAIYTVAVILGFSFQDVSAAAGGDGAGLAAVAWLGVSAVALALAFGLGARPAFNRFLLVFAVARLALPLVSLIDSPHVRSDARLTAEEAHPLVGNDVWSGEPVRRPDIYWLVFDSYPNDRVLSEIYEFDNRPFLRFLARSGFYVARQSYANFNKTKASMATAFNMEHVFEAGDAYAEIHVGKRRWLPGKTRSGLSAALSGDNRSVAFLKQSGYAYVQFDNRYWPGFRCRGIEDHCIHGELDGPSEVETALLAMTPYPAIRELFAAIGSSGPRSERVVWAASGTGVPEFNEALADLDLSGPTFVYAHFTAPHPPFLNAADCRRLPEICLDPLDFKLQVQCVNRQLRTLVEQILRVEPEAILIVSGDHGPRLLDVETDMSDLSAVQVRERLGILSALRLPRECRAGLRQTLAPVNFMRIVFACLGGHPPRLTSQRHFLVSENIVAGTVGTVLAVDPYAE